MSNTSNGVVWLTRDQAISVNINPAAYKGDVAIPYIHAGTVTVGEADSDVSVTVTGAYPDYYLNFVLPPADDGADGADGVTPNFTIGNVTSGSTASATITGTKENPVLSLVLPIPDVPYITEEAEGDIVTIEDAAAAQALSAVSYIEPVQAGEGDPSPQNIRPITGHEGCGMVRMGKNLFNIDALQNGTNAGADISVSDGGYTVSVTGSIAHSVIYYHITELMVPGTTMHLAADSISEDGLIQIEIKAASGTTSINILDTHLSETFVVPTGVTKALLKLYANATSTAIEPPVTRVYKGARLSFSSMDEWQPCQGSTHTADFPQTVYGGSYDFVTGRLTVDRGFIESYAGETLPGAWISSMDAYQEGAVPTTGAQVCYELATPLTYDLTPQQVDMLFGYNQVVSSTGESRVVYIVDTKAYIDGVNNSAKSAMRLKDTNTGTVYELKVIDGKLTMTEVE